MDKNNDSIEKLDEQIRKLKEKNERAVEVKKEEEKTETVEDKKLEDTIIFLGKKKNPYPYYQISDCVVLTSDYEGYPVVFLESMILKRPLITTKVSDYEQIEEKFGVVTSKEVNDIYNAMKNFIQNGFELKEEFNYQKYNEEILQKLEKLF